MVALFVNLPGLTVVEWLPCRSNFVELAVIIGTNVVLFTLAMLAVVWLVKKLHHGRFQFGLLGLMGLVAACATLFAWLANL